MNKIFIPKEGQATLVMIMIPIGSYYEPNNIKGISHFIEHMVFKGSKKRTQKEINLTIERFGGDLNAFTDTEMTCYWAKIANKYKNIVVDVVKDMVINPIFPEKEIDKEREVILQELIDCDDHPSTAIYDLANKYYYPKNNGFHLPIIGTQESLKNINKQEILKYYRNNYTNPTLIIIGNIKNKIDISQNMNLSYPDLIIPQKYPKKVLETRRNISQANILIMADINNNFPRLQKEILLDLLGEIYNDMSGRLFSTIREQHHLVYRIRFSACCHSNGIINWNVKLGLNKNKIDKAYNLIMKELNRPITKKELNIAITKAIGAQALKLDNLNYIAENIAFGIRSNLNWNEYLFNYEKNVYKYKDNLNDFLKTMNFERNILAGIVPK